MSKKLTAGDKAPAFKLASSEGGDVSLASLKGQKTVLYFYPRDDTPGCTREAIEFTGLKKKFAKAGTRVFGVSSDTIVKHKKFIMKHDLGIELLSDESKKMLEAYGVWVEKNMYGKKSMGIERTTLLIDEKGKIARAWNKVKVDGHAEEVLEAAQGL